MITDIPMARELLVYSISRDGYVCRIDIATEREQLHSDFFIPSDRPERMYVAWEQGRGESFVALRSEADKRGIALDGLVKLPVPIGYTEPEWVQQFDVTRSA
jgi:hypothetical protein